MREKMSKKSAWGGGSKIRRAEGQRAGQVFTGKFFLSKGIFAIRDKYFNSFANSKEIKIFLQVFLSFF